jgi:RNA polymerase sigma-70 factor (ECF subfamily)
VEGVNHLFDNEEDLTLVSEVLLGNVKSFEDIVNKYEIVVFRFVYSMIRDKQLAEDITQEVFISVYNKMNTFDSNYKFSNWILRIAKNRCIDYVRKYKKINEANIDEVINISSKEISPEETIVFKEVKEAIQKYIGNLNEIDKQIILLRYSQKSTFNDISKILEISESSVKRRYYKVKDQFKKYIEVNEKGCEYEL